MTLKTGLMMLKIHRKQLF